MANKKHRQVSVLLRVVDVRSRGILREEICSPRKDVSRSLIRSLRVGGSFEFPMMSPMHMMAEKRSPSGADKAHRRQCLGEEEENGEE